MEEPTIVGGQAMDLGIAPFAAAYYDLLFGNELFKCGGSIIARRFILTAAHCMNDDDADTKSVVRVGTVESDGGGQVISVAEKFMHPRYRSDRVDLALLYLKDQIQYNSFTKPVRLPPTADFTIPDGTKVQIVGFGRVSEHGHFSVRLLGANVNILNLNVCKRAISREIPQPTEVHLCAYSDKADACQGDSGGGLVWKKTVVGVVSYGSGCARKGNPGVYTKVASEIDWINGIIDARVQRKFKLRP